MISLGVPANIENHENIENQRIKYESLSDTFYTIVFESEKALHSVLLTRNLLIKSLIYNKFSKEHLYFQHGDPKENVKNIKLPLWDQILCLLFCRRCIWAFKL